MGKIGRINIDKGVPLDDSIKGSPVFPWGHMVPGDSFFAPGYIMNASCRTQKNESVINASGGNRKIPGSKWSARTVTENGILGVRVWRTA